MSCFFPYRNTQENSAFPRYQQLRFMRKITPGETMTIRVTLSAHRKEKAIATATGEIFVGDEKTVTGNVILAMR